MKQNYLSETLPYCDLRTKHLFEQTLTRKCLEEFDPYDFAERLRYAFGARQTFAVMLIVVEAEQIQFSRVFSNTSNHFVEHNLIR